MFERAFARVDGGAEVAYCLVRRRDLAPRTRKAPVVAELIVDRDCISADFENLSGVGPRVGHRAAAVPFEQAIPLGCAVSRRRGSRDDAIEQCLGSGDLTVRPARQTQLALKLDR